MSNLPAVQIDKVAIQKRIAELMPENEAQYLLSVLKNNIVALGTDEAFALRDADGAIRAFKQPLKLSLENGTLVQPVPGGPCVVSAQGYEIWAEATGSSIIFPKEVYVDGTPVANPAVIRDPVNHRILCIYCRAVAFRFSSKGIPQVSDWTTIFDNPSYRMIDLLAKAKNAKQAFRLLPVEMEKPEDDGTWAKYPFDESTNLWINTKHEEALSWYSTIINREKKSIDFAQTFAKRNALKHLSGLQKVPGQEKAEVKSGTNKKTGDAYTYNKITVVPISEWTFSVLCWRPMGGNVVKWDATRYSEIQNKVSRFIETKGSDFASEDTIDVIPRFDASTGREEVGDDLSADFEAELNNPEDQIDETPPQEPPTNKPRSTKAPGVMTPALPPIIAETNIGKRSPVGLSITEDEKIMANFDVTRTEFPAEFKKACMVLKVGFGDGVEYPIEVMVEIMNKVNELVDQF